MQHPLFALNLLRRNWLLTHRGSRHHRLSSHQHAQNPRHQSSHRVSQHFSRPLPESHSHSSPRSSQPCSNSQKTAPATLRPTNHAAVADKIASKPPSKTPQAPASLDTDPPAAAESHPPAPADMP